MPACTPDSDDRRPSALKIKCAGIFHIPLIYKAADSTQALQPTGPCAVKFSDNLVQLCGGRSSPARSPSASGSNRPPLDLFDPYSGRHDDAKGERSDHTEIPPKLPCVFQRPGCRFRIHRDVGWFRSRCGSTVVCYS